MGLGNCNSTTSDAYRVMSSCMRFKLSMVIDMDPKLAETGESLPYQSRSRTYHAILSSTTSLKAGLIHQICNGVVSGRVVIPSQLTSVGL